MFGLVAACWCAGNAVGGTFVPAGLIDLINPQMPEAEFQRAGSFSKPGVIDNLCFLGDDVPVKRLSGVEF